MPQTLHVQGVISDLDGVVYRGNAPVPEAVALFAKLRDQAIPYAFVTNNSAKSREDISAKLNDMGFWATPENVINTSWLMAEFLHQEFGAKGQVYVVGSDNLKAAVAGAGLTLADNDVDAVVVGLDRAFDYEKLTTAQRLLLGSARFLATNPDRMIPQEVGFIPGAGSLVRAIETASGRSAEVLGKPQPHIVTKALSVLGTQPAATVLIGDQLQTDIAAGQAAGVQTVLVRTGVRPAHHSDIVPDIAVDTLAELEILKSPRNPTPRGAE
ncbi:HAD-IIA family hydrolase [Cognatishimia sp.]|uniref:HAD-IIA family hydrolase n=1 Tax=Cognatishimia sp. TaxID=2211648 RepID=UPI0035168713